MYLCNLTEINDQQMLMAVICFSPYSLFISEGLQGSIALNYFPYTYSSGT